MVSGNTKSLNYVSNDGTCDVSWLTMLLGNALTDWKRDAATMPNM